MFSGLDIQLDFAMYEDEKETKKKAKLMKKKGGKPLGGKLFKMTQMMPKQDPVKPRADHKMKEEFQMRDDQGPSFLPNANMKDSDMQNPHEIHKAPRARRIVGAQIIGKDGKQIAMDMPLNGSNPEELNAQLAAFLEQQKQAEEAGNGKNSDTSMPAINGRNVANNNTSNSKSKKDSSDPFLKKYNQKNQGKFDDQSASGMKALDLKNQARHKTNQGRKNSPTAGDLQQMQIKQHLNSMPPLAYAKAVPGK